MGTSTGSAGEKLETRLSACRPAFDARPEKAFPLDGDVLAQVAEVGGGALWAEPDPKEVAAITGHASLREIERYTKAAEQEKLARQAIARLIRNG